MDESSIVDDSIYGEDSIEDVSTDQHDETKAANVIDDSDDEGTASSRNSYVPSAASSSSDLNIEGRLTPSINRAIRRSIHRFVKESSVEEDIADSSDDSDNFEPVVRNKRGNRNTIKDDTSEDELNEENTRHTIEEFHSPEEMRTKKDQRNAGSTKGSKSNEGNLISISEDESSDDEHVLSHEESRHSIRKSLRPEKQRIQKRPRDRSYETESDDDESEEDESYEKVSSSRDRSRDSIEEAESPGRDNRFKGQLPALNASTEVIEIPRVSIPHDVIDVSSSSEEKENDPGNALEMSVAISMAKEETQNIPIDPVIAQQRALLICKQQKIQTNLAKTKMLLTTGNMAVLPDRGERLRLSITKDEKELEKVAEELKKIQLQQSHYIPPNVENVKPTSLFKEDSLELDSAYLRPKIESNDKELGKKAQETLQRQQSLTVDRLKDLHGSLLARPAEDEKADNPKGLKVPLMPHQRHALAWLLWRERQKPPGGVLADDMGLGKTLTMISLVIASIAKSQDGEDDKENDWISRSRPQKHFGGTLVVAPASLVAQWEGEVNNRCKRGLLSVELYHGNNRESVPKRLAKNDMVITSYNLLSREFKSTGVLYKIRWNRIILDEAHVIRNHKSQTCEAVCGLHANKRWALTGTPIHNKEMDIYSILKFLQCSPFDDVHVWKRWVDNKNAAGHERLATVMKTLMLRRTKAELQAKGLLETMPDKSVEIIEVNLDPEERLVYDKVMVYSRTLFAQFLTQRAEKAHMFELGAGKYDKPSWAATFKDTQFTKAQNQLLSLHADVQSHEILVLLLRLRQVCCHPALIHSMLDQDDIEQTGLEENGTDIDLLSKMDKMDISRENQEQDGDCGVDERVREHLLTSDNPVFDPKRRSSKMRAVLAKVEEIVALGEKLIIVSQWVGVLNVIADELQSIKGVSYSMFTGQVAVKLRQGIMDDFNSERAKPNVLLLSLSAGGVGLNLVGANHLLLIDIHWNPQLESQAQDRIYRFGQKKNVYIYKYICTDTIEERIRGLQEKKLDLATAVLSGGGKVVGSKLSFDDMKSLFSL